MGNMCKQSDIEDLEIKTESGVETYNEFKEIKDFRKEISKMNKWLFCIIMLLQNVIFFDIRFLLFLFSIISYIYYEK